MSFGAFNKRSQSTTFATSNTAGFSEVSGQVTAVLGSNNTVTDMGAVQGALDLSSRALEQGYGLAGELSGKAFDYNQETAQRQIELYQGYGQQLQNFASKQTADAGDKMTEVIKWLIGAVVVIGAASLLRKGAA